MTCQEQVPLSNFSGKQKVRSQTTTSVMLLNYHVPKIRQKQLVS